MAMRASSNASWKIHQIRSYNKDGYECTIVFNKAQNRVISYTDNCGINIKVITEIVFKSEQIYVALSGDQCALTNIRINKI